MKQQLEPHELRDRIAIGAHGEIASTRRDGSLFILLTQKEGRGDIIEAEYWSNLKMVKINEKYVAGLQFDGTVLLMDQFCSDASEITKEWPPIKEIVATHDQIIGLGNDGIVYLTPGKIQQELFSQKRFISLYAGCSCLVGIDEGNNICGFGDGKLPEELSNSLKVIDIFCSNHLDETLVLNSEGKLIGSSEIIKQMEELSSETNQLIQCGITPTGKVIVLNRRNGLLLNGKNLIWHDFDPLWGESDKKMFDAFCMSNGIFSDSIIATTAFGDIGIWGIELSDIQRKKVYWRFDTPAQYSSNTEFSTFSSNEKRFNILHAIDVLHQQKAIQNPKIARTMEVEIDKFSDTLKKSEKRVFGVSGTLLSLVAKSHFQQLIHEWENNKTVFYNMQLEHDILQKWYGPYRYKTTENSCCCGNCGHDRSELIIYMDTNKNRNSKCIICIESNNLFCAVCGEIVDSNDERIKYNGYCVCRKCLDTRQNEYAAAGSYVANCSQCGKSHVQLRLFMHELLCESCYAVSARLRCQKTALLD